MPCCRRWGILPGGIWTLRSSKKTGLRGRHQGEVAGILQSAVSKTLSLGNTSIVLDEEEAIVEAVRRADPGDLVVVFYEDWQAVTRALNTLEQTAEPSGAPMPAELVSGALSHRPQPMV